MFKKYSIVTPYCLEQIQVNTSDKYKAEFPVDLNHRDVDVGADTDIVTIVGAAPKQEKIKTY